MTKVGSIGVEIFFIISGFVISASALGEHPRGFVIRRAIRLLPALWICSSIALLARLSVGEDPVSLTVAYFKSIVLSPIGPYIDGVVWTLVVEAAFYLLIFFCICYRRSGVLNILPYALGTISSVFITFMFIAYIGPHESGWAARVLTVGDRFSFKVFLLRHGVFFATGALISAFRQRGPSIGKLLFLGWMLIASTFEIVLFRSGFLEIVLSETCWWLALTALAFSVHFNQKLQPKSVPVARLSLFAGNLSYPLYLSHYSLGAVLVFLLARTGLSKPAVFVGSLGAVLIISIMVTQYPERLIQRELRRLFIAKTKT